MPNWPFSVGFAIFSKVSHLMLYPPPKSFLELIAVSLSRIFICAFVAVVESVCFCHCSWVGWKSLEKNVYYIRKEAAELVRFGAELITELWPRAVFLGLDSIWIRWWSWEASVTLLSLSHLLRLRTMSRKKLLLRAFHRNDHGSDSASANIVTERIRATYRSRRLKRR
jgi:hypothetical protein